MESNQHQGTNMDEQTYRFFCIGLRRAMAEKGYETDTEFSAGIMHNVSFSNAMNPNNPTVMSEKNRIKCAKRLNMDINDIVNVGRAAEGEEVHAGGASNMELFPPWNPDELFKLQSWELMEEIDRYTKRISDSFDLYARMIGDRVRMLAKERNRLDGELKQQNAIMESMSDAVKVQTRDRKTVYSNRSFKMMVEKGLMEECGPEYCERGEDCHVDRVCASGNQESRIIQIGESWYDMRSTPVFGMNGNVDKVVTVIRNITKEYEAAISGNLESE